jgi:uncharacterized protein YggT (Ycf19 family)
MSMQSVEEYERRAQEAEASSVPVFLKVARAMVWFLYAVVVVTVVMLLLAFVLRLLGASTDAAFTRWVYRSSESMMRPFRGIFPVAEVGEASVVDVSLLIGAVAYLMAAIGVDALVQRIDRRLHREQVEIANARANADNVRLQFEAQQQQAQYAAQQQAAAQQFALQQEAGRRQQQQQAP